MLVFLLLGFISAALLLLFLYFLDEIKMIKMKVTKEKRFDLIKRTVWLKILVCSVVMVIVSRTLPFFIWIFGNKDMCQVQKVLSKNNIYHLSTQDNKYYVGQGELDDSKCFVINISEKKVLYKADKKTSKKSNVVYIGEKILIYAPEGSIKKDFQIVKN